MEVIIKLIIVLLVIVVPTIGRLLAKSREEQAARMRPGGAPQPKPQPAAKTVQGEIEGFLRRVAEQQQGKKPAAKRPQQRKAATPPVPQAQPIVAKAASKRPVGGQVTEHVQKHLDSSKFQRRSQKMGGEVAQADEKFEQRLQGTFDHKLGTLAATSSSPGAPAQGQPASLLMGGPAPAAMPLEIAALFATPESVRQAIIINEILQRPVHRW